MCSPPYSAAQAAPTTTSGKYTISLHYPVPDSEITDPVYGVGLNDGPPCGRLRVIVAATESAFFGGVMGKSSYTASRSRDHHNREEPAEPDACPLAARPLRMHVSGGVRWRTAHDRGDDATVIPGVISVDSDGTACSGSQTTVSVTGSGTLLQAIPAASTPPAAINLMALPLGATTCVGHGCDAADVAAGRVTSQPVPAGKPRHPSPRRLEVQLQDRLPRLSRGGHTRLSRCCDRLSLCRSPRYRRRRQWQAHRLYAVDNRRSQLQSQRHHRGERELFGGLPGGLTIGTGSSVTFSDGNVVLDGGLSMSGSGVLNINTANATAHLSAACIPPTVTTPCIGSSSAAAGIMYVRSGDISLTGGTLVVNHTMTYLASGVVKVTGGAPPTWLGPTEGPFAGLSLWAEAASNKFSLNGGASAQLSGTFFTPEAKPFSLAGGGNWGQQHARSSSAPSLRSPAAESSVSPPTPSLPSNSHRTTPSSSVSRTRGARVEHWLIAVTKRGH